MKLEVYAARLPVLIALLVSLAPGQVAEQRYSKEVAVLSAAEMTRGVGDQSEVEERNLKTIKTAFDQWRSGTGSPFGLLAPNARWTIVGKSLGAGTYNSRQEFIDKVIAPFNARMSKPLVPTIRGIYADGDTVVVHFDAEGTAKDGQKYSNTYAWFMRMHDGAIVEATAFFDSLHFNELWTRVPAGK